MSLCNLNRTKVVISFSGGSVSKNAIFYDFLMPMPQKLPIHRVLKFWKNTLFYGVYKLTN
jgi:hypothetical protein